MAKRASRCKETTTTTGTGTLSLGGAVAGYRTILSAANIVTTDYVEFYILDGNGTDWEHTLGKVTSGTPDTLTREKVLESSNAGALLNLSANTHTVLIAHAPSLEDFDIYAHISTDWTTPQTINNSSNSQLVPATTDHDPEGMLAGNLLVMPAWADSAVIDWGVYCQATGSPSTPLIVELTTANFRAPGFGGSNDNPLSVVPFTLATEFSHSGSIPVRRNDSANPSVGLKVGNWSGSQVNVSFDLRMRITG